MRAAGGVAGSPPPPPKRGGIPGFPDEHGSPSRLLTTWVGILTAMALALLGVMAVAAPLRPAIALLGLGIPDGWDRVLGLGFWLAFGFLGGLRSRERPGGWVVTFTMPFVVAATVLGGGLAGGLLGVLGELEPREFRDRPWYGVVVNHATVVVAAIGGWAAGEVVHRLLADVGVSGEAAFLATTLATGLAFGAINGLLVIPTIALRLDVTLNEAAMAFDPGTRMTIAIEAVLAWLMAMTWVHVGWWGPVVCIVLVVLLWQFVDNGRAMRTDELTGLPNRHAYRPRIVEALTAASAGRQSTAILYIDLDGFKRINDVYLYDVGDEVIRTTARRLERSVRPSDMVGRSHVAGDEFVVVLNSVPDLETATMLAYRLQRRILEPIKIDDAGTTVSVGASIGVVHLDRSGQGDISGMSGGEVRVLELAAARMQEAKEMGGGIVSTGEGEVHIRALREPRRPERPSPHRPEGKVRKPGIDPADEPPSP